MASVQRRTVKGATPTHTRAAGTHEKKSRDKAQKNTPHVHPADPPAREGNARGRRLERIYYLLSCSNTRPFSPVNKPQDISRHAQGISSPPRKNFNSDKLPHPAQFAVGVELQRNKRLATPCSIATDNLSRSTELRRQLRNVCKRTKNSSTLKRRGPCLDVKIQTTIRNNDKCWSRCYLLGKPIRLSP